MERISYLFGTVQLSLFPALREEVGDLTEKERQLVFVLELLDIEKHIYQRHWLGRKPKGRKNIARAFVAKAFYNFPTTEALIDRLQCDGVLRRLCGWEYKNQVPGEWAFSRAFTEFAESGFVDIVHETLVKELVGNNVVFHISRDATAIEGREKPVRKESAPAEEPKVKAKRGRPKKGETRPVPEKTRLEKQREWSLKECNDELPTACDVGTKKNAKGYKSSWIGYKFHIDVADSGIPISAITTSASVHDSQAAIPLAMMSNDRVESFYDLMDSAYDAEEIRQTSIEMGHVPIIDRNARGGKGEPMEPDRARRYNGRSASERFNSDLKDNHGGSMLRVKGHKKVHTHLMFGLLVIFAMNIISFVT